MHLKRISFFLFLCSISLSSQTLNDVLGFTSNNPNGTARFESMGGAFGALGGDLSAININPAGSAVFNDNEYGFTLSIEKKTNKTLFFNNSESEDDNNFSFNQGGAIWILKNYGGGNINKISFGINVQTNNSYKYNFLIKGRNDNNSIDSFFLNNSYGISPEILNTGNQDISGAYRDLGELYGFSAQQAFLAYQAYLINYDDNLNQFFSIAKYNNGVDQEYSSESKGYNNKYNLNIGIQFKEDYYFGFNLNTHDIYIEKYLMHYENNFDNNSAIKSILFQNNLVTQGKGISFQVGAIRKFKSFRLGISYHSPTWYSLWDQTSQYLETQSIDIDNTNYTDIVNPRITNIYPKYRIATPSTLTFSSAIIVGKLGLISIDLETKDFSNTKVNPRRDFGIINNEINTSLQKTLNLRLGTEFRLNKISLRAGYNKNQSPYKKSFKVKDANSYSFGIGLDLGSTILNLSHKTIESEKNYQLFDTGLTDSALINTTNSISSLSVIFKF